MIREYQRRNPTPEEIAAATAEIRRLQEIVEKFPSTQAAIEAGDLLTRHGLTP